MKKLLSFLIISTLLAAATGCKKEKDQQVIIIKKPKVVKAEKPQRMGNLERSTAVTWMGGRYTVEIKRTAVDSLPLATDGVTRYYDNSITVSIVRADGSTFFTHKFLKSDFKNYVDASYYNNGALLGIAFEKAQGKLLFLGTSVGSPDRASDEYVPLIVKVDNFGNYTIEKDTKADVNSMRNEPDTEEE